MTMQSEKHRLMLEIVEAIKRLPGVKVHFATPSIAVFELPRPDKRGTGMRRWRIILSEHS